MTILVVLEYICEALSFYALTGILCIYAGFIILETHSKICKIFNEIKTVWILELPNQVVQDLILSTRRSITRTSDKKNAKKERPKVLKMWTTGKKRREAI